MERMLFMLASALLLFVSQPSDAQVRFGVRAGIGSSALVQRVEGEYNSGSRIGFGIAGLMEVPIYKSFSFRPELSFVNQGGSYLSNFDIAQAKYSFNKCYYYSIQMPLNLAYTFMLSDVKLNIFVGPALDFSLFGKMKTTNMNSSDIEFGTKSESDLRPFDLGVNVGLMVEYAKCFFTVNSVFGTLDRRSAQPESEPPVYQNNVTFSLGYFFK